MNKAFLFVIMLVSVSFVGCIEDSTNDLSTESEEQKQDSEESTQDSEEEIHEPVGVEEESTLPAVYFLGVTYPDLHLAMALHDSNGFIKSYSIENNETFVTGGNHGNSPDNFYYYIYCGEGGVHIMDNVSFVAEYDCHPASNTIFLDMCNNLNYVNQTITVMVEDNEGHTASADYDIKETDFERCPDYAFRNDPVATFFVSQSSSGIYYVSVIKVSNQTPLEELSFFLKDGAGDSYVGGNGFGEVAMQYRGASWNNSGYETGIDMTYSGDDEALKSRAANISNDDGSQFPVHFSDNDRDGRLSSGDQFLVYGPDAGPAEDGWKLEIRYDVSGSILGSAKLM